MRALSKSGPTDSAQWAARAIARGPAAFTGLLAAAALSVSTGCGRTDGFFAGVPSTSGGAARDAAVGGDAQVFDAGLVPDAGVPVDAGPGPNELGRALARAMSCELDEEQMMRAAARYVSCAEEVTMSAIMDAHEGFALGATDPFAAQLAGLFAVCGVWQCAAEASSCQDLGDCLGRTAIADGPCRDFEFSCAGDVLGICIGPFVTPHMDCAALGASCERGACVRNGCRFGNGEDQATCAEGQEDLQLCDDYRIDCSDWRGEDATCASFYVGGEVPIPWCSPVGVGSVPGAYNRPVDCRRGGSVEVVTFSGRRHQFDCRAAGYRGCNERGCRE